MKSYIYVDDDVILWTSVRLGLRPEYLGLNGSLLPIIQISALVTVSIENS